MQFLLHMSSPSSWIWKIARLKGLIFLDKHTPMLPWRMQFLLHISSPSSQIWKSARQKGVIFLNKCFEYPQPYVILKNAAFAQYLLTK